MGRAIDWVLVITVCLGFSTLSGVNIYVDTEEEVLFWQIEDEQALDELYEALLPVVAPSSSCSAARAAAAGHWSSRQPDYIGCRDYHAELTEEERADLRFIVVNLANKSLAWLALHKSKFESAGDRIDHVHPLRFLMTIFTDDEMIVGVHNIRPRGWVWGDFIGGVIRGMGEEYASGNVTDWMIQDFAHAIGVDARLILPVIHSREWTLLVEILIRVVPRSGDGGRYDL